MRTLPHNALELGPLAGPWIDATAFDEHHVTLAELDAAAAFPADWSRILDARPFTGVTAIIHDAVIRFMWRKGTDPVLALNEIERHENGLPYALAGAVLAAATAKAKPCVAPHLIAMTCRLGTSTEGTVSQFSNKQIDSMVSVFIEALPSIGHWPAGAVDRARFVLRLGRLLWEPMTMRKIGGQLLMQKDAMFLGTLAAAHLALSPRRSFRLAGVDLAPPTYVKWTAEIWPQMLEWCAGEIPAHSLRHLTRGALPAGQELTIDRLASDAPPNQKDARLLNALAQQLVDAANAQRVYQPSGDFMLTLPDGFPLRAWGVQSLRVSASPAGLWCAVVTDEGKTGANFEWRPDLKLRPWVVTFEAMPVVNVTMAALWRDLCIAGEQAVPPQGEAPRQKRQDQTRQHPAQKTSHRWLPRAQHSLTGPRQWGNDEEQETIRRRAHGVRAHLRLSENHSQQAEANAAAYGWVIPEGYTFVRPHVRGEGDVIEHQTIVHAKGLATIMAFA